MAERRALLKRFWSQKRPGSEPYGTFCGGGIASAASTLRSISSMIECTGPPAVALLK